MTKQNIDDASKTLTAAFFNDALNLYFFPEEDVRLKLLPEFYKYRIKSGILYGRVLATSDNFEGVVIITPSENHDLSLWKLIRAGVLKLSWKLGTARIIRMMSTARYIRTQRNKCIHEPHYLLRKSNKTC